MGQTWQFSDHIHKIHYGEVVPSSSTNATLTVNTKEWIVYDDPDGKARKFVVDAFCTNIDKEYPRFLEKCPSGHVNCPYVRMYRSRYAVYAKLDKMRQDYIASMERLQNNPSRRSLFFERRPPPIRRLPRKPESSTVQ